MSIYSYESALKQITEQRPLSEKLGLVHQVICTNIPTDIRRIAVAIYEPKSDLLKTYIHSSEESNPLSQYQQRLADVPSLQALRDNGKARVVNDLGIYARGNSLHTRRIQEQGYGSSYTVPMYRNGRFQGFIFFNATRKDSFDEETLHYLDLFAHLLTLMVTVELDTLRTLAAAVKTASDITQHRDNETGCHLDRMSRYSRLITQELAPKYGFDDEFIEHIFLFSPLHDIGKIAIPDKILLKPDRLNEEERAIMQTHTLKGRKLIDTLLNNFDLDAFYRIDVLRNIAEYHHEKLNGTGYPHGLKGDDIPIESRIVAVADIFDALTSQRPYKRAWNNDEAFDVLDRLAGTELDQDCVAALSDNREQVEHIQKQFAESQFG